MDLLDCEDLFRTNEGTDTASENELSFGAPGLLSDLLSSTSPCPSSSDDDDVDEDDDDNHHYHLFEPQRMSSSAAGADVTTDEDPIDETDRPLRCWRHFERHFDYMVERCLRPVEDYVLGRSPLLNSSDWNHYQQSQGHVTSLGGFFSGCNGAALQGALADLIRGYKLMWKDMFGGYECPLEERINALQFSVERDFQHLVESGEKSVDTPCFGSVADDLTNANPSNPSVDSSLCRDELDPGVCTEKLFTPTPTYGDEPPVTRTTSKTSVTSATTGTHQTNMQQMRNTLQCPGYVRCDSEMITMLERRGFEPFYAFMDQLFLGLEGCRAGGRYIYAMELLTSVLRLMPEFIALLIRPKLSSNTERGRRLCYLKRMIIIVRSYLKYMGLEPHASVSDMYRDAYSGCFVPFYLLTGDKDLQTRQAKSAMTATLLLKLFSLIRLIGDKCMGWVFLSSVSTAYSCRLIQRLKRFVYMPLFSMKQVHELVVPLSGNFPCAHGCLFDFDYLQWVKSYLHPPPPLYMLRSELVKLIRLCVLTTRMNLSGWYNSINEALMVGCIKARGVHYEDVLRRHIFLLIGGLSFFLASEFLSVCVGYPESFFGSFFLLLPHIQYSLQRVELDAFVEKEIYMLQEHVLDLIKVTVDREMLSHDNLLGLPGVPTVQSTIIRRILGLAWHYATAPSLDDNDSLVDMHHVVKVDGSRGTCRGQCLSLAPYSASCSIDFLCQMASTPVRFRQKSPDMKEVPCVFTTADELEAKVRRREEFVNHSRIAANDYIGILGGISESNPIEIICGQGDGTSQSDVSVDGNLNALECAAGMGGVSYPLCTIACMLRRHMLYDGHTRLEALRWSVVMQGVNILVRYMGEREESTPTMEGTDNSLGPTTPMWHALVDMIRAGQVKGELPTRPTPDAYSLRESFLGRPIV